MCIHFSFVGCTLWNITVSHNALYPKSDTENICRATREKSKSYAPQTAKEDLISAGKCADLRAATSVRITNKRSYHAAVCAIGNQTLRKLETKRARMVNSATDIFLQEAWFDFKRLVLQQATSSDNAKRACHWMQSWKSKRISLQHRPKLVLSAERLTN